MKNLSEKCGTKYRLILLVPMVLIFLGGCTTTWYPAQFSTVQEAFPDPESMVPLENEPETFHRAVFSAAYEDVFRAALVSVSQVQLNVITDNKRQGYILAQKVATTGNAGRMFYAIVLKEQGAKETTVTIMSKVQGSCPHGLGHSFNSDPFSDREMKRLGVDPSNWCPDYLATVHWTPFLAADLNQFMTFVRNNLIAAGLY